MTKEEKDLLLKDLCARLPYGVIASYYGAEEECETWDKIEGITCNDYVDIGQYSLPVESVKPYLFHLSSMSDEQKKYINDRWGINEDFDFEINPNWGRYSIDLGDMVDYISWLNKNHFDYRGLISKGLAIDCTNLDIY